MSWLVAGTVLFASIVTGPLTAVAAASCQSSGPGSYTVSVCFESPASGATVTGPTQIDMSVTVTGPDPGTAKLLVYLDGAYLLTEYELPFTFVLPTADMADGARLLEVEAKMRDDFVTARAGLTLNLSNGNAGDPVNTNTFTPSTGTSPAPGQPFVLAAGGDGAAGRSEGEDVVQLIEGWNPNMFLYLGDVYDKGTYTEFFNWYGEGNTRWGKFRSITNPSIGNHEYNQDGYAYYWDNVPNYYSYDANGWHFLSLDIQEGNVSSTQTAWIASDLASNTAQCTIAFFHTPVVSLGPIGSTPELDQLWALLVDNGVDIVLTAHEHNYQRFLPMDRDLQADPAGAPQFIVGASGHGIRPTTGSDPRAAFSTDQNPGGFGALKLELNGDGAAFRYINTDSVVLDSGTIPCSGPGPDTSPPTPPATAAGSAGTQLNVDLTWDAASDNVGVETYRVYRNSTLLAEVDGSILAFTDAPVSANTTYTYEITAVDLAQNESSPSSPVVVTTPPPPSSLTFAAKADAYVSDSDPSTNYGSLGEFKIDETPLRRAFVRFDVDQTTGPITSATLRVYGLSNHTQGFDVWSVADDSWVEATITHASAPAPSSFVGSSGSVTSL
ncbi:MAG: DNRLRE domain-containing protein [Acidimicrobiia bacterium]|nr:DNRLRE domain-containing protein [Acidimicrobiia bacterium]